MLKSTEKTLKLVYLEARSFKSTTVNSGHLLLAILKDSDSIVTQLLVEFGVNYYMVRNQIQDYKEDIEAKSDFPEGEDDDAADDFTKGPIRQQPGQKKGPSWQNQIHLFWIILESISQKWQKKTASILLLVAKGK